jgi:glycine cleavage system H protein
MADNLLYSRDHAWVRVEGKRAVVGLSEFARSELGEVSYVELPPAGKRVARGEVACALDSLKSASDLYSPMSGTVAEANARLTEPGGCALVNEDPLGEGWLFSLELEDPAELSELLDAEGYRRYLEEG